MWSITKQIDDVLYLFKIILELFVFTLRHYRLIYKMYIVVESS